MLRSRTLLSNTTVYVRCVSSIPDSAPLSTLPTSSATTTTRISSTTTETSSLGYNTLYPAGIAIHCMLTKKRDQVTWLTHTHPLRPLCSRMAHDGPSQAHPPSTRSPVRCDTCNLDTGFPRRHRKPPMLSWIRGPPARGQQARSGPPL